jgi:hypothetical protein
MNDKELLDHAARAAGMIIDKSPNNGGGRGNTGFDLVGNLVLDWHNNKTWNPLTDDGDRYRLARALGFVIDFELHTVGATIAGEHHLFQWGGKIDEAHAFVIAAAEIGRNTQ